VSLKAVQIITKRGFDIIGPELIGAGKDRYVFKEVEIVGKC
jgi:hypothetical protein